MKYCITHEVPVYNEIVLGNACIVTACPPPDEMDLDGWEFVMSLPVPSDDELSIMDMNAEVLEADFIGDVLCK